MTKIKNILFDLGGVVMEIRRQDCVDAFRRLGMADPNEFLGEYRQSGPFAGIEDGSMSVDDFHDAVRPLVAPGTTDSEIDDAFMQFITGLPDRRLEALSRLRSEGYKVYMLSNTNPIMWHGKIADEFNRDGRKGMSGYFDGVVTSFEAKAMKPDAEIFHLACKKLGIKPEETIFLDDSARNTAAAAELGFQTLTVGAGEEFDDLLRPVLAANQNDSKS